MLRKYLRVTSLSLIFSLPLYGNTYAAESTETSANNDNSQCQLNILLTNDDGWQAPGIQTLFRSLKQSGHRVTMVAPLTQQSGRSSAINTGVGESVSIKSQATAVWSVDGTPADSVKAALGVVFAKQKPDLVISGANFGPNVGQQTTLNSGTLGASLTAHHAGIPAIAVSVGIDVTERDSTPPFKSTIEAFQKTADILNSMLGRLVARNGCESPLSGNNILSINVPVPAAEIKGIRYARLSSNELFRLIWTTEEGINKISYKPADRSVAKEDDDVGYFLRKYVTVTPLDGDLTENSFADSSLKKNWLPDLSNL